MFSPVGLESLLVVAFLYGPGDLLPRGNEARRHAELLGCMTRKVLEVGGRAGPRPAAEVEGRELLAACRALPEVTRALRALGSRRGAGGTRRNPGDREGRFFAPFISARRASMDARDARAVIPGA